MTSSISDLWVGKSIPKKRVYDKFCVQKHSWNCRVLQSEVHFKGHSLIASLLLHIHFGVLHWPFIYFFSGEFMSEVGKLIRFLLSNRFKLWKMSFCVNWWIFSCHYRFMVQLGLQSCWTVSHWVQRAHFPVKSLLYPTLLPKLVQNIWKWPEYPSSGKDPKSIFVVGKISYDTVLVIP